jgi:hypothetical protein
MRMCLALSGFVPQQPTRLMSDFNKLSSVLKAPTNTEMAGLQTSFPQALSWTLDLLPAFLQSPPQKLFSQHKLNSSTHHLPRVTGRTPHPSAISPGSRRGPWPWFLGLGWERLSSHLPAAMTVPARTCGPTHANLTHFILLLGRHRHAGPTSSQQWKPRVSTDSSEHQAREQELCSWA